MSVEIEKWTNKKIPKQLNKKTSELTLNRSHKWSPPKEKSTGHNDEAFLVLPGSTGCK